MRLALLFSCAASVAVLSACGSSGAGPKVAPTRPPPPNPTPSTPSQPTPATKPSTENFDTAEYRRSNAVVAANAIQAYQAGASGRGMKVGIVDTGLNPDLAEFSGRIDPASRDVAGNRPMGDVYGHGTAVASIIAGARNDVATQGMAFNSTIVMLRADAPGSCPASCYFVNVADGIDAARLAGARVINLSIGGEARSDVTDAVRRATNAGIIIVIGAGNDGTANPSGMARSISEAAPGQVIVVGALGSGSGSAVAYDELLSYSNQAGTTTDSYLSAPGYLINVVVPSGGTDQLSGTSFSAPVVSGAVALLAEAFPNLTARQIVQILMETADDLGTAGVDSVYGRGRLNVGRAFQPIGRTNLAGAALAVSTLSNGSLPAAAGDAASHGTFKTIILDAYDRAFQVNLASTVRPHPKSSHLSAAVLSSPHFYSQLAGPLEYKLSLEASGEFWRDAPTKPEETQFPVKALRLSSTSLKYRSGNSSYVLGFGVSSQSLSEGLNSPQAAMPFILSSEARELGFDAIHKAAILTQTTIKGIQVIGSGEFGKVPAETRADTDHSYRLVAVEMGKIMDSVRGTVKLSHLTEVDTLLGGRLGDVFGRRGASTTFLSLEGHLELTGDFSARLNMTRGWTKFASGDFSSSAFSVQLTKQRVLGPHDVVAFRISQPLRIDHGGLSMMLPATYDYSSQSVSYSRTDLSLAPRSREISSEISYVTRLRGADVDVNAYARSNPGHITGAPDIGAMLRFSTRL